MSGSSDTLMIGHYRIIATIGKGGMGAVYSAIDTNHPHKEVAVKVILPGHRMSSPDLLNFQKEAALLSRLSHPGIVAFYEFGLLENFPGQGTGYFLIMEKLTGKNLKQVMAGKKHDLSFFFQIALQIAGALDYTHGKNIIHLDIKPQNIMLEHSVDEKHNLFVKILDFGIARFNHALNFAGNDVEKTIANPRWAGTPTYMAPEQSGELSFKVDHRADLYALGCVLYEIIAGRTPFVSRDRKELRRLHAYEQPPALERLRPDLPVIIAQIVHKLLAKNPLDRYQSAFSLYADLLQTQAILEQDQASDVVFTLAQKDSFKAVSTNLPLIGFKDELQELVSMVDILEQKGSRSHIAVVKGEAGSGKSRLLREFRDALQEKGIRFIGGSFSQYNTGLPLNALSNAFNEYLAGIMYEGDEKEYLELRIKEILGSTAHSLAEIIPGLSPFIQKIPKEIVSINLLDDFELLVKVFSDLLLCLAKDDQPIIFIFENLQWADSTSIALIEQFFVYSNGLGHGLIISCRNDSKELGSSASNFMAKIERLGRRSRLVALKRLAKENIASIISDLLSTKAKPSADLLNYLADKSKGNPRLLVEYVRKMVLLDFLVEVPGHEPKIIYRPRLTSYPLRLLSVDIVLSQLHGLSVQVFGVLELCAVVGELFYSEMILLQGHLPRQQVFLALEILRQEGALKELCPPASSKGLGRYLRFVHHRVKEVIYEHMSPDKRAHLHLEIARHINHLIRTRDNDLIYMLAYHYNAALLTYKYEANKLDFTTALHVNLCAIRWAKKQLKPLAVIQVYLQKAWACAEELAIINHDSDYNWLCQEWAAIAWEMGDFSESAERYQRLLDLNEHADGDKRLAIVLKIVESYVNAGQIEISADILKQEYQKLVEKNFELNRSQKFKLYLKLVADGRQFKEYGYVKRIWQHLTGESKSINGNEKVNWAVKLAQLGILVGLYHDIWTALAWEEKAISLCIKEDTSLGLLLRSVVYRAAFLGFQNYIRPSYRLFDLVMNVASQKNDQQLIGFTSLLKAFTLDYPRGRHSDCTFSLKIATSYLNKSKDTMFRTHASLFTAFHNMTMARFTETLKDLPSVLQKLSATHPLRSRGESIYFYSLLMQGKRNELAEHGDRYFESIGKTNFIDIFLLMCQVMVFFAKGDLVQARKKFQTLACLFAEAIDKRFLFCHEEDLLGLFLFTFPLIFELEHGRALMRSYEMQDILNLICRKILKTRSSDRDCSLLLKARSYDWIKYNSSIQFYHKSIRKAQLTGRVLIRTLALIWLGQNIKTKKGDWQSFILNAWDLAQTYHILGLQKILQKDVSNDPRFKSRLDQSDLLEINSSFEEHPSELALKHGLLVSRYFAHVSSEPATLEHSLALLKSHYQAQNLHCLIRRPGENEPIWFYTHSQETITSKEVGAYCDLYEDLQSVIFLPLVELPWYSQNTESGPVDLLDSTLKSGGQLSTSSNSYSDGETKSSHVASTQPSAISGSFCAIIPIGRGTNSYFKGLILLENVGDHMRHKLHKCRLELDMFACQFSHLAIERIHQEEALKYSEQDKNKLPIASGDLLEWGVAACPWLQIERLPKDKPIELYCQGKPIGTHQYLLVAICGLSVDINAIKQIVALVRLHLQTLHVLNESNSISLAKVASDLLHWMRSIPRLDLHLGFAASFIIFDKQEKTLVASHIGKVQTVILGGQHAIKPFNEPAMYTVDKDALPYFETKASLSSNRKCLISNDTSSLSEEIDLTKIPQDEHEWRKEILDKMRYDHAVIACWFDEPAD